MIIDGYRKLYDCWANYGSKNKGSEKIMDFFKEKQITLPVIIWILIGAYVVWAWFAVLIIGLQSMGWI